MSAIYVLLASAVALSAFAVALGFAAVLARIVVPPAARRLTAAAPQRRAAAYLRMRLVPVAAAAVFSALLVLPTFLYYEPVNTDERLTLTMGLLALAGLTVVALALTRLAAAWRATRRLDRVWRAHARPMDAFASTIPVFAVPETFPTVAVVGCLRPALFVSERVLQACTAAEVQAMISHECAHISSRDNLKRLLLRACPRLPFAAQLERAWCAAAEEAADAAAAAAHPSRRLDLAQALVTIARLAPSPVLNAPVSAFYLGGTIESRVRLLLEPVEASAPSPSLGCVLGGLSLAGVAALFVAAAPLIHAAMESLVRTLP